MSAVKPIIDVRNLVNRFGKQTVHDGLDFRVNRGEIMGIVGGSGSGKSVLLRTMIGLRKPTSGEIEIHTDMSGNAEPREGLDWGVLFQNSALFSGLTVLENVMMPMREHTGITERRITELAELKLCLVGLTKEAYHKNPSELSGGMKKRVALARALALDPKILFLDEPTAGLDPIAAAAFDTLIKELHSALGLTVIIITHDLDTLFTICDRIAVLVDKKIKVDTLQGLLQDRHPWIQEYFHGPRARAAQDAQMNNDAAQDAQMNNNAAQDAQANNNAAQAMKESDSGTR